MRLLYGNQMLNENWFVNANKKGMSRLRIAAEAGHAFELFRIQWLFSDGV